MKILNKAFWTLVVIVVIALLFLVAKGIIWISSAILKIAVLVVLALVAIGILFFVWRKGGSND